MLPPLFPASVSVAIAGPLMIAILTLIIALQAADRKELKRLIGILENIYTAVSEHGAHTTTPENIRTGQEHCSNFH